MGGTSLREAKPKDWKTYKYFIRIQKIFGTSINILGYL